MIRRLALTAGFAVLSAVAFAPNASAQVAIETVKFAGTIESSCQFNRGGETTTDGSLVLINEGKTLTSKGPGGISADTTIYCNGPTTTGTISVGNPIPTQQAKTPAGDFNVVATVFESNDESKTASSENSSSFTLNFTDDNDPKTLFVDMEVNSTEPLPAGEYYYDVTVTATPN